MKCYAARLGRHRLQLQLRLQWRRLPCASELWCAQANFCRLALHYCTLYQIRCSLHTGTSLEDRCHKPQLCQPGLQVSFHTGLCMGSYLGLAACCRTHFSHCHLWPLASPSPPPTHPPSAHTVMLLAQTSGVWKGGVEGVWVWSQLHIIAKLLLQHVLTTCATTVSCYQMKLSNERFFLNVQGLMEIKPYRAVNGNTLPGVQLCTRNSPHQALQLCTSLVVSAESASCACMTFINTLPDKVHPLVVRLNYVPCVPHSVTLS